MRGFHRRLLLGVLGFVGLLLAACGAPLPDETRPAPRSGGRFHGTTPPSAPRVTERVALLVLDGLNPFDLDLPPLGAPLPPKLLPLVEGGRIYDEAVAPSDHGVEAWRGLLAGLPPLPGRRTDGRPPRDALPRWLAAHGLSSLLVREGTSLDADLDGTFDRRLLLPPHGLDGAEGLKRLEKALTGDDVPQLIVLHARCAAFPLDLRRPRRYPPRRQDTGSRPILDGLALDRDEGERLLAWARSALPKKDYQLRRILETLFAGPEELRDAWADGPFLARLRKAVLSRHGALPLPPVRWALREHRNTEARRAVHVLEKVATLFARLGLRRSTHLVVLSPCATDLGSFRRGGWLPGDLAEAKIHVPLLVLPPARALAAENEGLPPLPPRPVERIPQAVSTLGLPGTVCALLGVPPCPRWPVPSFSRQILGGRERAVVAANDRRLVIRTSRERLVMDLGSPALRYELRAATGGLPAASSCSPLRLQMLRNAAWELYETTATHLAAGTERDAMRRFADGLLRRPLTGVGKTGP